MRTDNVIQQKSYAFAVNVVGVYRTVVREQREFVLSKQLVRSGTSIGANVEEAIGGQSRKDFASKMSVAYKEARETLYWLRLLQDSGLLDAVSSARLKGDCEELLRILSSILVTTKRNEAT